MDAQAQRKLFDSSLHMILERRADGVIVIASWVFEETNLLADVKKNNVPVVIIGRDLSARGIDSILVDNEAGGAIAARHLKDLGHRRIAVIRGPQEMVDSEPRWVGIQRVAAEAGLEMTRTWCSSYPALPIQLPVSRAAWHCEEDVGRRTGRLAAVIAFDDLTALGVVRGLSEAGFACPRTAR